MRDEFDFKGTLMNKDVELVRFSIEKGRTTMYEQLCADPRMFPFEMGIHQNSNTLINALLVRVVPETRQGLLEKLEEVGIHGYDLSAILRYQNASSFDDTYWVRYEEEGPQTWEQLRSRLGYTTV